MEKYIKKINDKLLAKENIEEARKAKKIYRSVGYSLLGVGLFGFVGCFITFMVLFLEFKTETAFTFWIVAVPFLLMLVPGSVLARVGDVLLTENNKNEKKLEEIEIDEKEK